jgi:molybdopterin synthase catalytic subunit
MMVDLRDAPLSLDEAMAHVSHPGAGGVAVFLGTVRAENDGHAVSLLEYQAYASMAVAELTRIATEIERAMPGVRVAALHRTGALRVGEIAVICAASAPHRGESFAACRELIERIKARVPIWKREEGPDGVSWVGWVDARCAADHDDAGHEHH